ncbi:MAG: hypothetical protein ACLUDU_16320 [Butyricimonas faecihominis]
MGRKYNYVDIDFAVRVLNHPELIDDEEMRLWLRDEGHCRLLEELRRVREGSLRTVDGLRPDVNSEWVLSRKLFRKRMLRVYRSQWQRLVSGYWFRWVGCEPPVSVMRGFSDGAGGRGLSRVKGDTCFK